MRLVIALALLGVAPLALAAPDPTLRIGEAELWIGQGCHDPAECHPEAYAWVRAQACLPSRAAAFLEAERVSGDAPLTLVPLDVHKTGAPMCPFRATGGVELWAGIVDAPLDCVRGTILSTAGVLASRAACFSDL